MGTTTETSSHHRELTKTEIEVATAQIIDRLARQIDFEAHIETIVGDLFDKCTHDGPKYDKVDCPCHAEAERHRRTLLDKYDIPHDLYHERDLEWDVRKSSDVVRNFKPWIKRYVQGSLYESVAASLITELGEMYHINVAWVFLQKYEPREMWGLNRDLFVELIKLGSRSQKKWHRDMEGKTPKREWWTFWTGACGYKYPSPDVKG